MDDEAGRIDEARRGSTEAFAHLLRAYHARVRAYLGRFVRDRDFVDDLAQETFLAAYRSLATYRDETPFRIWILGIARHRALRFLREEQQRRERQGEVVHRALDGWLADAAESGGPDVPAHERELRALQSCLESLPARSAALVTDYYFRRRRAGDIARKEGRKESAVWMTLLRVRQALRRCVQSKLSAAETAP